MIVNKPYTNKDYADLAVYCNENDCHIEDKGDFLESVKNVITPEQEKQNRIEELKGFLRNADYWGQKYIDGEYTDDEWEVKKEQRKAWRAEIRELEDAEKETDGTDNSDGV